MTDTAQHQQDLMLQKSYLLGTGSMASANQLADLNTMLAAEGGAEQIDSMINRHVEYMVAKNGIVSTFQTIARNGYGLTLSNARAQLEVDKLLSAGIDTGARLFNHLNAAQWEHSAVLDNRGEASMDFLQTLSTAGNNDSFTGSALTHAAYTLLQNIDGSAASLANGKDGFDALSLNLSTSGITGTMDAYLSGATVFADSNGDGEFNQGEWTTTTSADGTFEAPNNTVAGRIIVTGGTDLLTGNTFQGFLGSSTGSTLVNPLTTIVQAMVSTGHANTVGEATSAIAAAMELPVAINLLSYSPLAVLSSNSASAGEKAVALQVQAAAHQISNVITHAASVIAVTTPGATLNSAAAAAVIALSSAMRAAADGDASAIDLTSVETIAAVMQTSVSATGSDLTPEQISQVAQVTAGSNASAASATTVTMLAQAADVAQGSATNALIAGATSGDFSAAVNGFTGAALTSANYEATVGSIAPGVPTAPTAKQTADGVEPTPEPELVADSLDMTTALDNFEGSAGDDVFSGTYGDGSGPYTFNVGDILNGLAGNDTLKITTGAEASSPPDTLWNSVSNFENVIFASEGNGAQSITTGAAFEAAFATGGVDVKASTLLGAIDVTMTTFTGEAAIRTTTNGDGAHTIVTGSGVTTVNATGLNAGAQTINGVGLSSVVATINGAGDQVIGTTNGGNLISVTATIKAAGSQSISSTSDSDVTIVASAAAGSQTITTAGGNDSITTTGAAGEQGTLSSGSGDDVIVAGLTTDVITSGTGSDTMTGGGGVDTFAFGADGSVIGIDRDSITDFNTAGADILTFAGDAIVLTADATTLVAGENVNTSAGGLISFHADDNDLAKKVIALQADAELDAANSVAMFTDGGNTYVYHAGAAIGNLDDQLIQLTGIDTLTTMTGGSSLVIA